MEIKQEEIYRPVTITLETKAEYLAFIQIVSEADNVPTCEKEYMGEDAKKLAIKMSNHFTDSEGAR